MQASEGRTTTAGRPRVKDMGGGGVQQNLLQPQRGNNGLFFEKHGYVAFILIYLEHRAYGGK